MYKRQVQLIINIFDMRERCLGIALFGFIIKNPVLLESLNYKLNRILNFEATNHNYFRQHITDIKESLIKELEIGNIMTD